MGAWLPLSALQPYNSRHRHFARPYALTVSSSNLSPRIPVLYCLLSDRQLDIADP